MRNRLKQRKNHQQVKHKVVNKVKTNWYCTEDRESPPFCCLVISSWPLNLFMPRERLFNTCFMAWDICGIFSRYSCRVLPGLRFSCGTSAPVCTEGQLLLLLQSFCLPPDYVSAQETSSLCCSPIPVQGVETLHGWCGGLVPVRTVQGWCSWLLSHSGLVLSAFGDSNRIYYFC